MVFSMTISITGPQLKAARALARLSGRELAQKAQVAHGTIKRIEADPGPIQARTNTVRKLVAALERAGVEFIDTGAPGVRLRPQRFRR